LNGFFNKRPVFFRNEPTFDSLLGFTLFGSDFISWGWEVGVRKGAVIGLVGAVTSSALKCFADACGVCVGDDNGDGDGLTCSVSTAGGGAATRFGAAGELAMTFADE